MMPFTNPSRQGSVDPDIEALLTSAVEQAESARDRGDLPFGAVLRVADGRVFAAGNAVRTQRDPLAHAETGAMREAISAGFERAPDGSILACSGEPCPMCLTSAHLYGIRSIVCVTTMHDAGRAGLPTRALYRLVRGSRRRRGVRIWPGGGVLRERAERAIAPVPSMSPQESDHG